MSCVSIQKALKGNEVGAERQQDNS